MKAWLEGLGLSKETVDSVMAYISNLAVNYAGKVAGAIVVLVLAMIVSGWARSATVKALTRVNFDPTLTKFFGALARWVRENVCLRARARILWLRSTMAIGSF